MSKRTETKDVVTNMKRIFFMIFPSPQSRPVTSAISLARAVLQASPDPLHSLGKGVTAYVPSLFTWRGFFGFVGGFWSLSLPFRFI